jgi:hypothetical protein
MHKNVYIKNVDSDGLFLLQNLQKLGKTIGMNKETFTLKDVSEEDFQKILELQQTIQKSQNKKIIISKD